MRKPQGREPGLARRAHLRHHLRDPLSEVEALRKLCVDKQTDFDDGLFLPLANRALRSANDDAADLLAVIHQGKAFADAVQWMLFGDQHSNADLAEGMRESAIFGTLWKLDAAIPVGFLYRRFGTSGCWGRWFL